MRSRKMFTIPILGLGLVLSLAVVCYSAPMGTAWTYQGRLMDANKPADGLYDFRLKLCNEPNGASIGDPPSNDINDIDVIDGYFTVELDFGSNVFNGNAKWLEVSVRPGDSNDVNDYVTLSPRHEVTPTPYALQTRGIFVDSEENVGIGTKNPTGKLHVDGDKAEDYMDGSDIVIKAQEGGDRTSGGVTIRGCPGGDIILLPGDGGVGPFGIPGLSGNIGVGTTDPSVKLDVTGAVNATQFCINGDCRSSWVDVGVSVEMTAGESISQADAVSLMKTHFEPISSVISDDTYSYVSYNADNCAVAQSFVLNSSQTINKIHLRFGGLLPFGGAYLVMRIETDSGSNSPSGNALAMIVAGEDITPVTLDAGIRYWIVIYSLDTGRTGHYSEEYYFTWPGRSISDQYPEGRRMTCNSLGVWSTNGTNNTLDVWAALEFVGITPGTVWKARADYEESVNTYIGLAGETVGANSPLNIILNGVIKKSGWGLSAGSLYYLAGDPGMIDITPGAFPKKVGLAISPTELILTGP